MDEQQDTFPRLLLQHARTRPNHPATREKDLGIWQTWTWAQVADEVRALACGLAADGFKRGMHLAIVGDNRPRLYWSMIAAQALGVSKELGMNAAKVNPNGGAIALGHPIGATGCILTIKAMYELQRTGGRYALITMCIGGGQGIAAVIERV